MLQYLNQIADIRVGYQPKTCIQENAESDFFLLQGKDFNGANLMKKENILRFSPERNPHLYLAQKGDVLFLAKGIEHFAYYVDKNFKNTLVSASFYILKVKTREVLPEYLAWVMNQQQAKLYFDRYSAQTAVSFLSKQTLGQLEIHIPSINVQQKICNVVKLWKHEMDLYDKRTKIRSTLINKLCMNVAKQKGER